MKDQLAGAYVHRTIEVEIAITLYRTLLGREPENVEVLEKLVDAGGIENMVAAVAGSEEHARRIIFDQHGYKYAKKASFVSNSIDEQLNFWKHRDFDRAAARRAINDLDTSNDKLVIEIDGSHVKLDDEGLSDGARARAHGMTKIIQDSLLSGNSSIRTKLVIFIEDEAEEILDFPAFSFQKVAGTANILLPDFEFAATDYMSNAYRDTKIYDQKRTHAVFAGATTGGGVNLSLESVICAENFPRLRAARFFKNSEDVTFLLPSIVQCLPDAEAYLRREGFGTGHMSWKELFDSKFVISMDGNGATCSRQAIALSGNSVFLKYASKYVLFWSNRLRPWVDFIPISTDKSIVEVVERERNNLGIFEHISNSGRQFANDYLDKQTISRYTYDLLKSYGEIIAFD